MLEPENDGGNKHASEVVSTALVIARCYGSEVFEPIDATFNDVSTLVRLYVASRWTPTLRTLSKPVLLGIFPLRADTTDAPSPQHLALLLKAVGAV